jgi:hypothetical protein
VLAKAGDFVELVSTTAKFKVSADKKILVAQYMVGQGGGFGTRTRRCCWRWRPSSTARTTCSTRPTSWTANYVDIIAPDGTR